MQSTVQAWDIEKNSEENIYLNSIFLNTTSNVITALTLLQDLIHFNNPVLINNKENFSVLVQDLRLLPDKYQEIPNKIFLPDSNIRKIELYVQQICYEDGKIESLPEPCYIQTCQQKMDVEYIPYAQKINKQAKYYMIDQSNYWQCICRWGVQERCVLIVRHLKKKLNVSLKTMHNLLSIKC